MQAREQIDSLVQNGIRTIEMAGLTATNATSTCATKPERARAAIGMETDPERFATGQPDHLRTRRKYSTR